MENKNKDDLVIYVGMLDLDYDMLLSVGRTYDEAKINMSTLFENWIKDRYECSINYWVMNMAEENFADYNNDTWNFLENFYNAYIQKVNNYAIKGF